MYKSVKTLLVIALLGTLVGLVGCSSSDEQSDASSATVNDDVFVLMKDTDLYVKYPEKDEEKVASNVLANYTSYLDDHKGMLYVDEDQNLYSYINSEKQKIASDISLEVTPYDFSVSGNTLAYVSGEDNHLYAYFKGKDKVKIASNVAEYEVTNNGESVYYLNDEDELYVYSSDDQKDKIASDVYYFAVSDEGTKVVLETYDGDLYIRDMSADEKEKIASSDWFAGIMLEDDGELAYLADYDEKGELFFKSTDSEPVRIASDVVDYYKNKDTFYYVNDQNQLLSKEIGADQSEKIADDVKDFMVLNNKVHYVDADHNMFRVDNSDEKTKVANDILLEDYVGLSLSVIDGKVVYLSKDRDLYFNEEKISSDVDNFVAYVDRIVYTTNNGELYSTPIKKVDAQQVFNDINHYSEIYYGNQLIHQTTLSLEEIEGVWEAVEFDGDEDDSITYFMEITMDDDNPEYGTLVLYDEYGDEYCDIVIGESNSQFIELYEYEYDYTYTFFKEDNNQLYLSGTTYVKSTSSNLEEFIDLYYDDYDDYYYDDYYYDDDDEDYYY